MTKKPTAMPPIANTASDPAAVALATVASANCRAGIERLGASAAGSSSLNHSNRFCSFAFTQEPQTNLSKHTH